MRHIFLRKISRSQFNKTFLPFGKSRCAIAQHLTYIGSSKIYDKILRAPSGQLLQVPCFEVGERSWGPIIPQHPGILYTYAICSIYVEGKKCTKTFIFSISSLCIYFREALSSERPRSLYLCLWRSQVSYAQPQDHHPLVRQSRLDAPLHAPH